MKTKVDKKKYRSDLIGRYLAPPEYIKHLTEQVAGFGVSLKDACEAIRPVKIKKPGDSRGKGRTMTAQEWIEFKKEEKENVEKS